MHASEQIERLNIVRRQSGGGSEITLRSIHVRLRKIQVAQQKIYFCVGGISAVSSVEPLLCFIQFGGLERGQATQHVPSHLGGRVVGLHCAQIDGGSLKLSGTFAEAVAFNGGGTLDLTKPAKFTGAIKNFASGAFIDLANITTGSAASLTYDKATHTLTVSDGTHSDKLTFTGSYKQGNFVATADGSGGTTIGWQGAPSAPHAPADRGRLPRAERRPRPPRRR